MSFTAKHIESFGSRLFFGVVVFGLFRLPRERENAHSRVIKCKSRMKALTHRTVYYRTTNRLYLFMKRASVFLVCSCIQVIVDPATRAALPVSLWL